MVLATRPPLIYAAPVPTPESADAFAKLLGARTRLTKITKELNQSEADILSGGRAARDRHAQLQAKWEEAFLAFELAADEFSVAVKHIRGDIESFKNSLIKD
jgi:hypothetical protein